MMDLNYENLCKLFVYAQKQGDYDSPYVDASEETILIDGVITRKQVEQFLVEQGPLEPPR